MAAASSSSAQAGAAPMPGKPTAETSITIRSTLEIIVFRELLQSTLFPEHAPALLEYQAPSGTRINALQEPAPLIGVRLSSRLGTGPRLRYKRNTLPACWLAPGPG